MAKTQAEVNINNLNKLNEFAETNDPNYRFVNFFNLNEASSYEIGAINDINKINFKSTLEIPGNQNINSCKLNATSLYNQINKTDYSASSNYKKGILEMTVVEGRMENQGLIDVDYFLDESAETIDYDLKTLITDVDTPLSIELFGYMVVPVSGNYALNIKPEFREAMKFTIAWIQNNAESSYRITNAYNKPIYLAKGVFIPFRIQMIVTASISAFPFVISDGTNTVSDFYSIFRDKKKKQVVFSLKKDQDKTQSCKVYTEGNIENYGIDNALWETGKESGNINITPLQSWVLDPSVDSVGLDTAGNLVAYSNNTQVGSPILLSNYPLLNRAATAVYQLKVQENHYDLIRLIRTNQFSNRNTTNTSSTKTTIPSNIRTMNFMPNREWNQYNRNILNVSDRITVSNPLVSSNKKIMLALTREDGTMILKLFASTVANTTFYGLNVDNKLGKTFYANQNPAKQYLREVPSELTAYSAYSASSRYANYGSYYPQTNGIYKTVQTEDCRKECNSDPTCTHVYTVTDAAGQKCLLSSGNPIYSLKQTNSPYTESMLHVRGKSLDINKMDDKSFQKVKYEKKSITGFNDYTLRLPLTKDSIALTPGEPEYIKADNGVLTSTSATIKLDSVDPQNKPAGIIQAFTGLNQSTLEGFQYSSAPNPLPPGKTIIQNISGQLIGLQGQIADYTGLQTRVANLARDISGNVDSINTQYANMSQNDKIYDFTTSTQINALDEDYSITPALLKDNAIYLEEQNNLKIVGTITLATVLMAAIFISR